MYQSRVRRAAVRASGSDDDDFVAFVGGEGPAHAAGDHPGRMDPLAAETLDDLLAEAAQGDPVTGELWLGGGDAEEVPAAQARRRSRKAGRATTDGRS